MTGEGELYDAEVTDRFRVHAGRLRGYLLRLGTDHALVDDIVQDSFLALRSRWPDVRSYDKPEAYLYKVATHLMRREQGKRYTREEPHAEPHSISRRIPRSTDSESDGKIWEALRRLPRRQREVVLLRHYYGFSCQETADILKISEGAAKNYLFLGLRRLAELWMKPPDEEEG